ncbi:MAG: D-alanyl-D-alanine carboxypeptidase/D-alanyl-D-alanine-endopeptidase [Planctomycetota bacterium]|nr:D-alanyl-D-alanine carboxypeptidase/D-alanyl-D-alanine-endopeptidase [Planctomycetota bacterium]
MLSLSNDAFSDDVMLSTVLCFALALVGTGDSVEEILERKALRGASISVAVMDAQTGERIFSRDIDAPRTPASNQKVLTTAAAISELGPDYLFTTRLLGNGQVSKQGVLSGDLILRGGGDPCLRADALQGQEIEDPAQLLAELLKSRGLTRIDGALVLDDEFLDRQWVHPDWEQTDLDFPYAAPVSALSIHGNCMPISLDGRGSGSEPAGKLATSAPGYSLRNEVKWASGGNTFVVGAMRPDDGGVIRLRGRMSHGVESRALRVPVRDGALLFGRCLVSELRRQGITVRGGIQREGGAARGLGADSELVRLETPLSLAVILANKESDNSISDHLAKVVGAEVLGDGSFAGGARAVKDFLRDVVDVTTVGFAMSDGSGLARSNRVTARQMVDTLVTMNQAAPGVRDLFIRSLPVAGLDGSLRDRLTQPPYLGSVRAKSGYIQGVSALSGYASTSSGRLLAFSILINDVPKGVSNRLMKAVQDDICRDLVDRF